MLGVLLDWNFIYFWFEC